MKTLLTTFAFTFAVGFGVNAFARTPDGKTPAQETVCNGEKGAAYGLCVAYCEAQDCDTNPKAPSCANLKANYLKKTGRSRLPCDPVPCACGEFPLWNRALSASSTADSCATTSFPPFVITVAQWSDAQSQANEISAYRDPESDQGVCYVYDFATNDYFEKRITASQALICQDQIRDWANAQGVSCNP